MHRQVVDLQQGILRCSKEERIVVRQTKDAVAQQLEPLKAAIEAREAGSVTTE